ncbi:MAG TPA: FMN-binding negative transcriptional regulator [Xanthomonadaceae bacterium]|jgi:transcriptional regulator
MYSPSCYLESDLSELDRLVAGYPFATLITTRDGAPGVTHMPVLYAREGERIVVRGHWSRANPQWRDAGDALLIVHGPHAYVSPSWYPDNFVGNEIGQPQAGPQGEPHGRGEHKVARVPTWNYATAHIHGKLEVFHDAESLAAIVSELSDRHEAANGSDWRFEPERADHRVQLKGIVGFRLAASRIELKFKLNQNHPEANRRAVVAGLTKRGDEQALAVAELMRARATQATAPEDIVPEEPATEP